MILPAFQESFIADCHHDKVIEKCLSCRQTVWEIHTMPDKIQSVDGKTEQKDHQHTGIDDFFLDRYLFTGKPQW